MTPPSTQVTTLLTRFGLTTAAEEFVPRLTQAGHHAALPVLLEVFEAEAEARRQRRIARLRRAARLPPGKTFQTLDTGRLPAPVAQQLETLATGASWTVRWATGCPWAAALWGRRGSASAPRRTAGTSGWATASGMLNRETLPIDVELGVEAQRRESPRPGGASTSALGRATVRW